MKADFSNLKRLNIKYHIIKHSIPMELHFWCNFKPETLNFKPSL